MIPKPLNEIEWADLEELRDSGREEDDRLEYKRQFSGGVDFLSFNQQVRNNSVDQIAKEVIAFLNAQGGDVIIGVAEAEGAASRIDEFVAIQNINETANRLSQSLNAIIEPYQALLKVKAVASAVDEDRGCIVVRVPPSLRAPHRGKRDLNAYVRRGRESFPMPMDEIQDLTLRKSEALKERKAILDTEFESMPTCLTGRQALDAHRIHFRMRWVPLQRQQVELTDEILNAFRGFDPILEIGTKKELLDVAFRQLDHNYRPILRGKIRENVERNAWGENDFTFSAKLIREDGVLGTDFACRSPMDQNGQHPGFHHAWSTGYIANSLMSFAKAIEVAPNLQQGFLRMAIYFQGPICMSVGSGVWASRVDWPQGLSFIPDFEISSPAELLSKFAQLQVDIGDLAGSNNIPIFSFANE